MSGAVLPTVLFLHGVGSGLTSKCRKDRHTDTHTEELEGGRLDSRVGKPQRPGNSACSLYRVEQKGRTIVYSVTREVELFPTDK